MKIIAVPQIGTEVDSFSSDYFNLVDPAVDQILSSHQDNKNASQAVSILTKKLFDKASNIASQANDNAIKGEVHQIVNSYSA